MSCLISRTSLLRLFSELTLSFYSFLFSSFQPISRYLSIFSPASDKRSHDPLTFICFSFIQLDFIHCIYIITTSLVSNIVYYILVSFSAYSTLFLSIFLCQQYLTTCLFTCLFIPFRQSLFIYIFILSMPSLGSNIIWFIFISPSVCNTVFIYFSLSALPDQMSVHSLVSLFQTFIFYL